GEVRWGCGSHDVAHPRMKTALTSRCATEFCRPQDTYPPSPRLAPYLRPFPPSRGPDAGPGGETVGEGRLSSGDGNSAAGPAIMVPPEAGPRTKADRDGRPLAPLLLNGRVKGRPLPCNRKPQGLAAFRHVQTRAKPPVFAHFPRQRLYCFPDSFSRNTCRCLIAIPS